MLFLASVALPSFLWNRDEWRTNDEKQKIDVRRAASDIDDDDENDSGAGGDAAAASRRPMDWYAKRRHEDRLSFHEIDYNINSNTGTNIHASHTSSNTSSIPTTLFRTTAASADVSLPQPPMPHPPLPHSSSSFESAPSQHFPATSNNCNWNHFEGYHDTTKNCVDYESLNDDEATNDADRNNVTGSNNTNTNHCSSETTETTNRRRRHHSDGPPTITPTKSQWPPAPPRRGLSHRSVTEGSIPLAQQPLLLSTTTSSVNTNNNNIMSGAGIVSKLWSLRRTNSVPELAAATGGEDAKPNSPPLLQQHVQNRAARSKYNASIMPNRLILIRHGQSLGNIDEKLYATTADNAMPLTQLGWEQAKAAGRQVRSMTQNNNATNDTNNNHTASSSSNNNNNGSVHFVMSPYVRTVETFHGIASAWCDPSEFAHMADREERLQAWYARLHEMGLTWNEDPRIREQDFGNYQEPDKIKQAKRDRYRFGAFYYRFPYGESASDVSVF